MNLTEEKIKCSVAERKRSHLKLLRHAATYESFLDVEKAAFKAGALDVKAKELMALSISIVTKCEPCMEWHLHQALTHGASEAEIYETIDVAIEMGGGPAAAYARFVVTALELARGETKDSSSADEDELSRG
ncbi:AhpD family alkylhydroperoxidase [Rhodopseudomonas julia]|uniref:AhpD family alkylhydroperoxidase n=1 Tax=Rhodopseudomonas julia TaxID=200617 RepID=A0ABU0C7Z8_9BRAD|nr:carboxymuconolactone decarboxylase family protein [Rhodopseudomonas julia]MDQ0326357.1 AhpD family alkylhydroperoxidase [Rhodopseudomonas julia]